MNKHGKSSQAVSVINKWTEMLRSGQYKQIKEHLCDGNGYCVLGMLCEAFLSVFPNRIKVGKDESGRKTYDGETFVLPAKIVEELGLQDKDGKFFSNHFQRLLERGVDSHSATIEVSLATLNDYTKLSFSDFASIIEDKRNKIFRA